MKFDDPDLLEKPSMFHHTPIFQFDQRKSLYCLRDKHEGCIFEDCICPCHYELSKRLKYEESR